MKKSTSKQLEVSEKARDITEIIVSIASNLFDFLKAVHMDLRQSLQRLHSMFPVVLSVLAAIGAGMQLFSNRAWFAKTREDALLSDARLNQKANDLANINGSVFDDEFEHLKKNREAAKQEVFRFGGNVFLCFVYSVLAILLGVFPGSTPVLIAALALSQAIATWRFAYALYEKRFSERKWMELFPDSISQNTHYDPQAFQRLLQHAVYHKAIMALCNAIAVGMILVATLFPPSAAVMAAMSFVMVLLVIGISISYQHHKERLKNDVCQSKTPDTITQQTSATASAMQVETVPRVGDVAEKATTEPTKNRSFFPESSDENKSKKMKGDAR